MCTVCYSTTILMVSICPQYCEWRIDSAANLIDHVQAGIQAEGLSKCIACLVMRAKCLMEMICKANLEAQNEK